jgi:4-amino-4-deoxy-L-arabinose transferase-like glycosyltransferase
MDRWAESLRKILIPPGLAALLLVALILLSAWSFAVPIFEAPDEPDHWQYAVYLRQNRRLPIYGPEYVEANSPPLYYVLMSPFAVDTELPHKPDPGTQHWSIVKRFQNSYSDFSKYWPLRGARLMTVLLSVVTVLVCYWAGLEASHNHTVGLLAAGEVAFLPQFTFRGMNISNDALVTLLCAVALYLIVRITRRGFTWPVGLVTAVVIALAFLSKVSAIFIPIPFALVLLSDKAPWRTRFSRLGVLTFSLVIVVPWLIRNQGLYGDPLASRAMLTAVSDLVVIKPLTSSYFALVFPLLLFHSFIGSFGWMSLWMPEWLYMLYGSLMIFSFIGFVARWIRHSIDSRLAVVLLTLPVLSFLILIYINLTFDQPQGRYLFPALPALAVIGAMGLGSIPMWSKRVTMAMLGALVILNIYILTTVIIPAYWLPI